MAIVGLILTCIRSKNWATFKNWDLKGGQCGSKIALVIFIYYIIKRGVGVRAHWALEYGYVTLKTQNTKCEKGVKNDFIWLLKAPVMNQNCFKEFYIRFQWFSYEILRDFQKML